MAGLPHDNAPNEYEVLRGRSQLFRWIGRVDAAIFRGERFLVTGALVLMTATVTLDIYHRFLAMQKGTWLVLQREGTTASWFDLWPIAAVALSFAALFHAVSVRTFIGRASGVAAAGLTAFLLACMAALSAMMLTASSSAVCTTLAVLFGGWLILSELDRPVEVAAGDESTLRRGLVVRLGLVLATTALLIYFATRVADGYTWASKFALFLLLWEAFIGASMATYESRHLRVDAMRKFISPRLLPAFNGISWLIAAVFTAAFCYVSIVYFQSRLGQASSPHEIPDWMKVLAIPVSLAMVTIRFGIRSVAAFVVAATDPSAVARPAPGSVEVEGA